MLAKLYHTMNTMCCTSSFSWKKLLELGRAQDDSILQVLLVLVVLVLELVLFLVL